MKRNNKIRNKIISSAVTLTLVISIFLCLTVVIQILNNGYVSVFGHSFFRVITGSMEPEIKVGELIHTKNEDISTLTEGDIISFKSISSGSYGVIITHRIVGISMGNNGDPLLLTKGDANPSMDGEYVTRDNYIGKVVWRSGEKSFAADLMRFITSKNAFMLCIMFPCLLICGFILKDSVSKMTRELEAIKKTQEEYIQEDRDADKEASEQGQTEYDIEDMREKIRRELIEELKSGDRDEQ